MPAFVGPFSSSAAIDSALLSEMMYLNGQSLATFKKNQDNYFALPDATVSFKSIDLAQGRLMCDVEIMDNTNYERVPSMITTQRTVAQVVSAFGMHLSRCVCFDERV